MIKSFFPILLYLTTILFVSKGHRDGMLVNLSDFEISHYAIKTC